MIPLTLQRMFPIVLIGLATTLASCPGYRKIPDPVREEAYVPIYEEYSSTNVIKSAGPKPIVLSGKIYVRGSLLFQVENMAGIHVIDYTNKQNPVKLGFIHVAGCSDIAVKGNHIIANNLADLVTIDISSPTSVKEVARVRNAFPYYAFEQSRMSRPPGNGFYVCPNYAKGYVKGWKLEKNVKGAYCQN